MKSSTIKFFVLTILSVFMTAFLTFADDQDNEKKQSTPPGWEQGKKTGWQGDRPPGLTEDELEKKKKSGKKSGKHKANTKQQAKEAQQKAELKKEKGEFEMETQKDQSLEEIEKKKKKPNAE